MNIRKYFSLCYSWKDLPVPCTSVWSVDGSLQVYQGISTSGSAASYPRDKSPCIPLRLDHPGGFTRTESPTYPTNRQTSTNFGMDYKLEEVYARTLTHSRLLGTTFQSRTSHSPSSRLILRFSHQCPNPSVNVNSHAACKISSIISRISHIAPFIHHGRLHLRFLQFWIKRQWSQHQQSWDTQIQLDAEFLAHLSWYNRRDVLPGVPLHLPEPSLFFFTDVFLTGWGASWQHLQLTGQWSNPRIISAHQLAGARSHQIDPTSVGNSVTQSDCSGVLWQQYGSSLHSQAGRDPFHISVQQNSGTLSSSGPVCDSPHSNSSSRSQECDSRCPCLEINSPSPTEWRIPQETLSNLFSVLGTPLVDMFAMAENKVTLVFVSPYPGNRAWDLDAPLHIMDALGLMYAFPPAPIVPKTLRRSRTPTAPQWFLIVSQHPSRPLLLQLSLRPPIPLTNVPTSSVPQGS